MVYLTSLLLLFLTWAFIHVLKTKIQGKNSLPLPPGPRPFPIIGNILEMGKNPHQSLTNLSKTFGPLMTLKLGSITSIVISSPEFAKEALQKHDQALSSRSIPDAARPHDHYKFSVAWLPASDQWRTLRKVMATEIFSSRKMEENTYIRRKKVRELLGFVQESFENGQAIDIGLVAFTTVLNLLSNTFFSIDLAGYNSHFSLEFHDVVTSIVEESGKPNLADYFPLLKNLDPHGIHRRANNCFKRLFKVFDQIIAERLESTKVKEGRDVLDSLIRCTQEDHDSHLSLIDIKHMLLDLFIAGTDTTTETLTWGMAELLRNPDKLWKLKNELNQIEGEFEESHIQRLPYLQATVKEIFRLHPVAPFLIPHKAEYDVEIGGFKIPKDAQVIVNLWAIGRDGSIWKNPDRFEPERFLESDINVKGRDFELIPFGAGRRICSGLPLAHRMLHLMLASLIHSFDWKLPHGIEPNELDMTERFGLALSKDQPLLAVPYGGFD